MGSKQHSQATSSGGQQPGKIDAPLNKKLADVQWGEFNLKNLFGRATRGKRLKSDDRIPGNLPFVTAGEKDEGVSAFIGNDVEIFPENTITIDMFGSAKYRSYKYGADDHIAVIHTEKLPKPAVVFITSAIHKKSYTGEFHYGKNFYAKDADTLNIMLPSKDGQVDYDFMERFIAELEAERIAELEAYLSAAGLKEYTLTPAEQQALDDFETMKFEEFKVGELFDISTPKKRFDANKVIISEKGNPYVVRTSLNNGIRGYIDENKIYLNDGNTISFGQDTATMFYQEIPYFTGDKIKILKAKSEKFCKNNAHFFIFTMMLAFSLFRWGSSSFSVRIIEDQKVTLPVIHKDEIDFNYMETFVSAIKKLVIKDVVQYADRKIAATKHVIKS